MEETLIWGNFRANRTRVFHGWKRTSEIFVEELGSGIQLEVKGFKESVISKCDFFPVSDITEGFNP